MDRIQELLNFLDVTLFLVNRKDRKAVRRRLTDLERGKGLAGIAPEIARGLARFAQRLAVFLTSATLDDANDRMASALAMRFIRAGAPACRPP
jgi:hypothetical protein